MTRWYVYLCLLHIYTISITTHISPSLQPFLHHSSLHFRAYISVSMFLFVLTPFLYILIVHLLSLYLTISLVHLPVYISIYRHRLSHQFSLVMYRSNISSSLYLHLSMFIISSQRSNIVSPSLYLVLTLISLILYLYTLTLFPARLRMFFSSPSYNDTPHAWK